MINFSNWVALKMLIESKIEDTSEQEFLAATLSLHIVGYRSRYRLIYQWGNICETQPGWNIYESVGAEMLMIQKE